MPGFYPEKLHGKNATKNRSRIIGTGLSGLSRDGKANINTLQSDNPLPERKVGDGSKVPGYDT